MLKSMTGFGRAEELIENYHISVQIKSVNHRFADFNIRLPRYYSFLEDKLRKDAMTAISRGKVEINISIEQKEDTDYEVSLNHAVATSYLKALRSLGELNLPDDVTISTLAKFNDVLNITYKEVDETFIYQIVSAVFQKALNGFMQMRREEGARLEKNLEEHLSSILNEVNAIEARSPETVKEYQQRLTERIMDVLSDTSVDESRILTEAAIYADKVAVDEEIVRLRSHTAAFSAAIKSNQPIGKKLDFIVQEMNREANTIGSKASDLSIAGRVVELKATIEKIREQIQNIE